MAQPPMMGAAAPPPAGPPQAADDSANPMQTGDEATDMPEDPGEVICTIIKNSDGTYKLIEGDEPEDGEDPNSNPGQDFGSLGELLKGVLEAVKNHESGAPPAGDDDADANFKAGFTGSSAPTPAPGMA